MGGMILSANLIMNGSMTSFLIFFPLNESWLLKVLINLKMGLDYWKALPFLTLDYRIDWVQVYELTT